jgi:tRNA (Thr-GGU) A37 N-methylase
MEPHISRNYRLLFGPIGAVDGTAVVDIKPVVDFKDF